MFLLLSYTCPSFHREGSVDEFIAEVFFFSALGIQLIFPLILVTCCNISLGYKEPKYRSLRGWGWGEPAFWVGGIAFWDTPFRLFRNCGDCVMGSWPYWVLPHPTPALFLRDGYRLQSLICRLCVCVCVVGLSLSCLLPIQMPTMEFHPWERLTPLEGRSTLLPTSNSLGDKPWPMGQIRVLKNAFPFDSCCSALQSLIFIANHSRNFWEPLGP